MVVVLASLCPNSLGLCCILHCGLFVGRIKLYVVPFYLHLQSLITWGELELSSSGFFTLIPPLSFIRELTPTFLLLSSCKETGPKCLLYDNSIPSFSSLLIED